jgi:peptidoglycan biosynthesis protein MviN/MurJ (putative lipid II flippase)
VHKHGWYSMGRPWFAFTAKLIVANGVLLTVLLIANQSADWWLLSSVWSRVFYLAAICSGCLVMYLLMLRLVGIKFYKFKL